MVINRLYGYNENWIGDQYAGQTVEVPGCGTWKVGEKISERSVDPIGIEKQVAAQAIAVFRCSKVGIGDETAILKLHQQ